MECPLGVSQNAPPSCTPAMCGAGRNVIAAEDAEQSGCVYLLKGGGQGAPKYRRQALVP
jgi:hypothetical protein